MNMSAVKVGEKYVVTVTLSKRNVRALMAKIDGHPPASMNTMFRDTEDGRLTVIVQDDEEHYRDRAQPPGDVHPDTEAAITRMMERPGG